MRPRIGINTNVKPGLRRRGDGRLITLSPDYAACVAAAGGLPIVLPPAAYGGHLDRDALGALLDCVDGLVLTGGDDIHPEHFGQDVHPMTVLLDRDRDVSDLALAGAALERDMPVLGVCGGMQLLNVVCGGTLHQHLPDLRDTELPDLLPIHEAQESSHELHRVDVSEGSLLARIVGGEPLVTNSRHHQAVARIGDGLVVNAVAEDGVVEGVEHGARGFVVGVQWHPEEHGSEPRHRRLFEALVAAAARRTAARAPRSGAGMQGDGKRTA